MVRAKLPTTRVGRPSEIEETGAKLRISYDTLASPAMCSNESLQYCKQIVLSHR